MKRFYVGLMLLVFSGALLMGQVGRGQARVKGVVQDEKGKPVSGAEVTMTYTKNEAVSEKVTTDENGEWLIAGLGSGMFALTVVAKGYLPHEQGVNVQQLSRNPVISVQLKVSAEALFNQDSVLVEEGNRFFEQGNYAGALEKYQAFLEKQPQMYQLRLNVGNCLLKLNRLAEARQEYEKVLAEQKTAEKPDKGVQAKALAGLGQAALQEGDQAAAQGFFKQSVDLDPKDAILAWNVAEIFFAANNSAEAIRYYELAAQIKPDWPEPVKQIGYAYLNGGDIPQCVEYMKKFLQMAPEHPEAEGVREVIKSLQP